MNCSLLKQGLLFKAEGFIPWHSSLDNEQNSIFKKTLVEEKKNANLFSLLGWEAGLVASIALNKNLAETEPEAFIQNLYDTHFASPRGVLKIDPSTHYFIAPVQQAQLQNGNTTNIIRSIENPFNEWNDFVKNERAPSASGWLNTYLCY